MSELVQITGGFVDRVSRLIEKVRYVRARSETELEPIYRLRYDANLREGTINPSEERRLIDGFDDTPNVYNFGLYIDGTLTSAMRLHILSQTNPISLAYDMFSEVFVPLVREGHIIVDGDRFVAEYPRARLYPQLPYVTLRLGIMAAEYFNGDYITASVRAEHVPFYQREFFAEKMCEPRSHEMHLKTYCLVRIDFRRFGAAIIERHGFYASTSDERDRLFSNDPAVFNADLPLGEPRALKTG